MRDDFLSIASHELRTPLTSLKLEVQLLQRIHARDGAAVAAEGLEKKLAIIARQVTRLTSLINNLLDVSRLTGGPAPLVIDDVDLESIVKGVILRTSEVIQQTGCEIVLRSRPVVGRWDRARVDSIRVELVVNAVKYGEGKPVEIDLGVEGDCARLVVTDHGMGIREPDPTRIFEKFERAVPLEHFGGLGLGLWIARQAAVAHGGDIRCESRPQEGSVFTVRLPLAGHQGS